MKKITALFTLLFAFALTTTIQAQFEENIKQIKVDVGTIKTIKGDLSEGHFVNTRFGTRASVNCFTESEKHHFNGNHVLYAFEVPANTKMIVDLSSAVDLSLYGYLIDNSRYDTPPYVENVSKFGCKSSHKEGTGNERILLVAGSTTMHVILGVAGPNESENGEYSIKITSKK